MRVHSPIGSTSQLGKVLFVVIEFDKSLKNSIIRECAWVALFRIYSAWFCEKLWIYCRNRFVIFWRHSSSPTTSKSLEDYYLCQILPSSWFEITLLSATKEKFTSLASVTRYNQKLRQGKSAGELMEMSLTTNLLETFFSQFSYFLLTKNVFAGKDLRSERSHFLELSKSSVGHSYYRLDNVFFTNVDQRFYLTVSRHFQII